MISKVFAAVVNPVNSDKKPLWYPVQEVVFRMDNYLIEAPYKAYEIAKAAWPDIKRFFRVSGNEAKLWGVSVSFRFNETGSSPPPGFRAWSQNPIFITAYDLENMVQRSSAQQE